MRAVEYRGYRIAPHGRRWRVQVRPVPIVRDTVEAVKNALDAMIASRERERVVAQSESGVRASGDGHLTVSELVEAWFAWKTGPETDEPIRARTVRDYRRVMDRFIVPLVGVCDAATITTADLKRDFFRRCRSRNGARYARTVLQQAFRWGIEERVVARRDNPCVDIRLARRDATDGRARKTSSITAVTDDQIPTPGEIQKMLIWSLETGRQTWWLWVYVASTLGLRPSEVSGLKHVDLDRTRGLVRIERSVPDRGDPSDWHMKTQTSRRLLKVGPDFFETISPRLEEGEWLFEARARGGGRPQRTHTATPCWPTDAPNREMRRMRRAIGLSESYTPYSLRHFVATRLILQGRSEIQVARFLGTSVDMLRQVYANHLDDHAQREIGEAVTNLF